MSDEERLKEIERQLAVEKFKRWLWFERKGKGNGWQKP
jgi:hypothetical protein